jgi:hypothetical protein
MRNNNVRCRLITRSAYIYKNVPKETKETVKTSIKMIGLGVGSSTQYIPNPGATAFDCQVHQYLVGDKISFRFQPTDQDE